MKKHEQLKLINAGVLPTPTNRSKVAAGVSRKLEKLLQEDAMIDDVLNYKVRLDKMRNASELSEEMLDAR